MKVMLGGFTVAIAMGAVVGVGDARAETETIQRLRKQVAELREGSKPGAVAKPTAEAVVRPVVERTEVAAPAASPGSIGAAVRDAVHEAPASDRSIGAAVRDAVHAAVASDAGGRGIAAAAQGATEGIRAQGIERPTIDRPTGGRGIAAAAQGATEGIRAQRVEAAPIRNDAVRETLQRTPNNVSDLRGQARGVAPGADLRRSFNSPTQDRVRLR